MLQSFDTAYQSYISDGMMLNSNLERLFVFLDETSVLSWCHRVYSNIVLHFLENYL